MPKMIKKADLPSKICVQCGRPFAWRKKWAGVWNEVKYCSDRCRSTRDEGADAGAGGEDFERGASRGLGRGYGPKFTKVSGRPTIL